jgi:hypothetical protein
LFCGGCEEDEEERRKKNDFQHLLHGEFALVVAACDGLIAHLNV